MSLLEELINGPSAADQYLAMAPMLGGLSPKNATGVPATGGPVGNVEAAARDFFTSHGYSPQDWRKVDAIIEQESGWNPRAVNESSGAAGLAQNIQGYSNTYSRNDPMEQIKWLFNYLNNHSYSGYGTGIDAAYAHKQATGWY